MKPRAYLKRRVRIRVLLWKRGLGDVRLEVEVVASY